MDQVIEPTIAHRIQDFRPQLKGTAFLPGEDGFAQAMAGWNLLVQHQPAIIVEAQDESDVKTAIHFATQLNLPIAVQSTGHGQFGTCEGGLLLNIAALNQVQVDPQTKTAKLGGGTRWSQVIEAASPYNLMPISGSSPNVGVVGYTMGGGYGILSRKYGLGVDQVISLRLIDPQGNATTVSQQENADLYWAILGGGGSFGVITEIEIQLHDQPPILGGSVMFDANLADHIYPAYLAFTQQAPDEVTSALTMMTFPPVPFIPEFLHGRSMIIFSATAIGDLPNAETLLAPMRSLNGAEFDSFHPMTYADTHAVFSDPVEPLPATCRGVLLKDLDPETLQVALDAVGPAAESANLLFRIRHYGGAIARKDQSLTSVGNKREAKYILYFLGFPMRPVTLDQMDEQAERTFAAIQSQVLCRGPLNWLGQGNVPKSEIKQTFTEEEYARQQNIKAKLDPNNRFRFAGVGLA